MTLLAKLAATVVAFYLLIALAALFGQRRLMYVPDRRHVIPSELGLGGVVERVIEAPDGARVIAWHGRARPGHPTILYFHGNAGSLSNRSERIRKYMDAGRGVFMMTYRGYGGSTGSPSEAANVADAGRAYDMLVADGVDPTDIMIYGESLGTGVAVQIAATRRAGGLILDAPFTSIVDVAQRIYPYLPVRPFLWDRYETIDRIGQVDMPVLIVHGGRDDIIPIAMGRTVFAAANEPKTFVEFPDAGHSDHHLFGSIMTIDRWIEQIRTPS